MTPASTDPPTLDRALDLVRFLRAGCSWDAEQTPKSLVRYLIEETFEVVAAIHSGDRHALRDELGDLLLNLAFQIVIAEEDEAFTAEEVTAGLEDKMRRRHPHLYGDGAAVGWEESKRREGRAPNESMLTDVPRGVPPTLRAQRLQERASEVGFDWPDSRGALAKLSEEIEELRAVASSADAPEGRVREELGDVLFSAVNVARMLGVSPADALEGTNRKFEQRFAEVERAVRTSGREWSTFTLAELDAFWDAAKGA